jgi:hypothetical protein
MPQQYYLQRKEIIYDRSGSSYTKYYISFQNQNGNWNEVWFDENGVVNVTGLNNPTIEDLEDLLTIIERILERNGG